MTNTAADAPAAPEDKYESDDIVAAYIEFHYGESHLGVDNFPVSCIKEVGRVLEDTPRTKALDLGCATGRSSFELAKLFDHVDALDYSPRLIETPIKLQSLGKVRYSVQDEGDLHTQKEIQLSDFEDYELQKDKVSFAQGDACNLDAKYLGYDLVFAGNLIDRLYNPKGFLSAMKERINAGGMLVLTSPYTWLEEYTPREAWLGGFTNESGENVTTLDGLRKMLSPEFEMVGKPVSVPMVIRETRRKFQHTFSELSAWRKIR